MTKVKIEHIDNLSKWKKSGNNIGSRAIWHHLYIYERWKYERAIKNKFLEITKKDRVNLVHLWDKVCLSKWWDHYILLKDTQTGKSEILKNGIPIQSWNTKELKHLIKTYI